MRDFNDRIAVITGAGSGIGRELARQLTAQGCHVAICDVSAENMAETAALCRAHAAANVRISTHVCDVSDESQITAFRDAVTDAHETDHINLLFNNAGVSGGGSFIGDERPAWDRTFAICWGGVYLCTRAFMPLLIASREGRLVNISSINGFWAALGSGVPHTAYSAAKFAVKGFTEALITDLQRHAPHVKAVVVMPGHVGTSIGLNSQKAFGPRGAFDMTTAQVAKARADMARAGLPVAGAPDEKIREAAHQFAIDFRDKAPLTAAGAATAILDGVRSGRWRILVGDDAHALDRLVRESPETAYEPELLERMRALGHLQPGPLREPNRAPGASVPAANADPAASPKSPSA